MFSTLRRFKDLVIPKLSNFWRRVVSVLIPLSVVVVVIGLLFFIYRFPEWQVEQLGTITNVKDIGELVNQYRTTWAQIIGGVLFLFGAYVGWRRLEVAREGQIAERYTRAIDQLGNKDQLGIRLGGIYALERIARDSEKDHWTVMEVLTVVGRRKWIEKETHKLDLNRTDLRGADLSSAHLEKALLIDAHLEGAILYHTHLEGTPPRLHPHGGSEPLPNPPGGGGPQRGTGTNTKAD